MSDAPPAYTIAIPNADGHTEFFDITQDVKHSAKPNLKRESQQEKQNGDSMLGKLRTRVMGVS